MRWQNFSSKCRMKRKKGACALVIEIFFKTGSHCLTHTDWGCMDGEHKAWVIVDVDSKEEARRILPPILRFPGPDRQIE